MSIRDALREYLRTDPRDAGCDRTLEELHTYTELAMAAGNPEAHFPGPAAHLRSCGACSQDHQALLRVLREFGPGEPW